MIVIVSHHMHFLDYNHKMLAMSGPPFSECAHFSSTQKCLGILHDHEPDRSMTVMKISAIKCFSNNIATHIAMKNQMKETMQTEYFDF